MIRINHVAIVVSDLEKALAFWVDALGLPLQRREHAPDEAVEIAFLPTGEGEIELLQPTDDQSGVARFLDNRGPGLHHLCLEVDDIEGAMERLREHGAELINETPRVSDDGQRRYVFVHPKSAGGVLLELYEFVRVGQ